MDPLWPTGASAVVGRPSTSFGPPIHVPTRPPRAPATTKSSTPRDKSLDSPDDWRSPLYSHSSGVCRLSMGPIAGVQRCNLTVAGTTGYFYCAGENTSPEVFYYPVGWNNERSERWSKTWWGRLVVSGLGM